MYAISTGTYTLKYTSIHLNVTLQPNSTANCITNLLSMRSKAQNWSILLRRFVTLKLLSNKKSRNFKTLLKMVKNKNVSFANDITKERIEILQKFRRFYVVRSHLY